MNRGFTNKLKAAFPATVRHITSIDMSNIETNFISDLQ